MTEEQEYCGNNIVTGLLQNSATGEPELSDKLKRELALWRALKPYIGRCLTLNHDINNPLAGIIGYTEFMMSEESPLTADQQEHLQNIMHCAERIRMLVDDLCREKIELAEKIDLRSVVETCQVTMKKSD